MKVEFKSSFARDLRHIKDKEALSRIKLAIENAEETESVQDISQFQKLHGNGNYYRIRVGDYRIGLIIEGDTLIFVRCLNRRDMYKYFPS